jgi:predicted RNA methylase
LEQNTLVFNDFFKHFRVHQDLTRNSFLFFFYSLFAAKTGASRVIAIEASEKMASVATQVCFSVV